MLALPFGIAPSAAAAAPDPPVLTAFERGGLVVVFATRRNQHTPVDLDDCSTQRNLTAQERADTRAIGEAFRAPATRLIGRDR